MKTITKSQAQQIDLKASKELGLSTLLLMENAGIRIAGVISKLLARKNNKRIAVICGKGNNAGDGLVVSRQLLCDGFEVDTYLLSAQKSLSIAAKKNLAILSKMNTKIKQVRSAEQLERINFSRYGVLVDAIFGVGLRGEVTGILKEAIEKINSLKNRSTIVSVDIPSGLDADKGRPHGVAVKADCTVSLVAVKKGLLINQGPKFSGTIVNKHIGFDYD